MGHPISPVARPVFFIGVPRSGTTVVFESVLHHEDVAWLPAQWRLLPGPVACGLYLRAFDNRAWHLVRHKQQLPGDARQSTWINRALPAAVEGYAFWQRFFRADLAQDFLLGARPGPDEAESARAWVSRFLRAAGRRRFIHKFTGPSRIGFLGKVFPDAVFVHLVREAPSVVSSLLRVGFWREGGGLEGAWWRGLPQRYLSVHRERPRPEVLAYVQWQAIVDLARSEAAELGVNHYREVRYEDFVADPRRCVSSILEHCQLRPSPRVRAALEERPIENRNLAAEKLDREALQNVEWAMGRLAEGG